MVNLKKIHVQEYKAITTSKIELHFKFSNDWNEAVMFKPTDTPEQIADLLHVLAENIKHNVKKG